MEFTLPIALNKELKIGKMPRFMPSSSKETKKRRIEGEDTGNPLRAHEIEEKKMWIKMERSIQMKPIQTIPILIMMGYSTEKRD